MSGFISKAACHGRRPASFAAHSAHERSALSARLLKDRDVARFIVAPDGYGKTFLAIEYAEVVFSWTHTFWVNAKSPCFIRDLDAGAIASACLSRDDEAALVVFDDLPALEPHRMEALSREIDALLAAKCEVVVTCVPTCDMAGGLQHDRIRIGARDLLLDDAEVDGTRSADERMRIPASDLGSAHRIPALAWAPDEHARQEFAKSVLYEEMPSDLLLASASVLVLQSGAFSDLLSLGAMDASALAELADDYPHLGFDEDLDRFEAPPIDIGALVSPLRNRMAELVSRSSCDAPEQLVHAWADLLVASGKAGRACDVVREVCPRRKRPEWLIAHIKELVRQACFFPVFRLAQDQDSCKGEKRTRLSAIEALCRLILGDEDGALRCAKRHAFDPSAPVDVRVCDLLVAGRLADGQLAESVVEALEDEASQPSRAACERTFDWALLARAWCAGAEDALALARLWCELLDGQVGEDELCVCASWLFGLLDKGQDRVSLSPEVRRCQLYIRERLRDDERPIPDYFAASAGLSLEGARNRGVRCEASLLEATVLIQLRKVEMGVLAQRRAFEEAARAASIRRGDWASTHPAGYSSQPIEPFAPLAKRSVPILTVHLFGRFEAALGDVPLEPQRFNRSNARTLLVLLAMNQGRDVARDSLERAMWPQSTAEVARKNYYAVWSRLRSILTLPDGTCPYLVRHRYGCRLESRYVQSDVERFSEICRELLFGAPNVDKWSSLFAEIDRDFSSDLMPAERKNALIVQARNEYRARLVDALVAATLSVIGIDNPQWGIWFARAALSHDETREDAYMALMRAQIAGNQRTAAMMTYLKCRRILSDQLGIDPSSEITALYESLLDAQ